MRDLFSPGRSAVIARTAMAATSHPLATATALDLLRSGGNAIDAAVAAAAVLAVVEPCQTGIGGDGFALVARPGCPVQAYDGSGRAPAAASAEALLAEGVGAIDPDGPHAVTVPGVVDLWARLAADHGTRGLDALLAPAIDYAGRGHPVQPRVAWDWPDSIAKLQRSEAARTVFLPGGRGPQVGEIFRQPGLAAALRLIAAEGPAAVYGGMIGEDIVATVRELGGAMSLEDLVAHRTEIAAPVSGRYAGAEVLQCGPNAQGIVALLMLGTLAWLGRRPADPFDSRWTRHFVEAARHAYALRDAGDWAALGSPATAERIAEQIAAGVVAAPTMRAASDTVFLCVVDGDRTVVSLINSIYKDFGGGIVTPRFGLALQNRGAGFVVRPGHPLCIGPRRRPLHTIMPALASRDGEPLLAFGVTGGDFQPCGQVQILTAILDCGLDPQEAIDLPRLFPFGPTVRAERGVPRVLTNAMTELGYALEPSPLPLGSAQAIRIDRDRNVLIGGTDPRTDGVVLGW